MNCTNLYTSLPSRIFLHSYLIKAHCGDVYQNTPPKKTHTIEYLCSISHDHSISPQFHPETVEPVDRPNTAIVHPRSNHLHAWKRNNVVGCCLEVWRRSWCRCQAEWWDESHEGRRAAPVLCRRLLDAQVDDIVDAVMFTDYRGQRALCSWRRQLENEGELGSFQCVNEVVVRLCIVNAVPRATVKPTQQHLVNCTWIPMKEVTTHLELRQLHLKNIWSRRRIGWIMKKKFMNRLQRFNCRMMSDWFLGNTQ